MQRNTELFRREAVAIKHVDWLGKTRVATPISLSVGLLISGLVIAGVVAWLLVGSYTRRVHVSGILTPSTGVIEARSRIAGGVDRVLVKEGGQVRAGDPLVILTGERSSESIGDTATEVAASLTDQQKRIQDDIKVANNVSKMEREALVRKKGILKRQGAEINSQLAIVARQVAAQSDMLERIKPLAAKGYVSQWQIEQQALQVMDSEAQLRVLRRNQLDVIQQESDVAKQLSQLPLDTDTKINDLQRQLSQGRQSIAQNEADRSLVVRATRDGIVAAVLTWHGQSVVAGQPLVTVVPAGSSLEATLFVPSEAIGFVKPGIPVTLRYESYPYQKFGVHTGEVTGASLTALPATEVASVFAVVEPPEPMYRVTVQLRSQTVSVYGANQPLRPGMKLDADLLLDKRRMIEWIFEPLYGFTNKHL